MNYRNARLANGFLSLDKLAGEVDLEKARIVSDGGAGVERMVEEIDRLGGREVGAAKAARFDGGREVGAKEAARFDGGAKEAARFDDGTIEAARLDDGHGGESYDGEERERRRKFHAAETKLRRLGLGYLVSTLALICKNGKDREESIREIASRRHLCREAAKARYFAHREKIEKIFLGQ